MNNQDGVNALAGTVNDALVAAAPYVKPVLGIWLGAELIFGAIVLSFICFVAFQVFKGFRNFDKNF